MVREDFFKNHCPLRIPAISTGAHSSKTFEPALSHLPLDISLEPIVKVNRRTRWLRGSLFFKLNTCDRVFTFQ